MKIVALLSLALLSALPSQASERKAYAATSQRPKMTREVVPPGKTYVELNASGQEIARFSSGQTMARMTDCAQVPCPSTFGKNVVCWKCKKRPATGAVSDEALRR